LVTILIAVLFGFAAYVMPTYQTHFIVVGSILCIYKIYCFWIIALFIRDIGKFEKERLEYEMSISAIGGDIEVIDPFTQI